MRYLKSASGTTAVVFALAMPAVLGALGVGVDFAMLNMKQTVLQSAGDAAALAGAKELSLASSNDSSITNAAVAYLKEELKGKADNATGLVEIDRAKGSVKVTVTEFWTPFFAQYISADITPVVTRSTASLSGETKICVLALANKGPLAFSMLANSHLQANGCGVYSNSVDSNGVYFGGSSTLAATMLCSSGGILNKGGVTSGTVLTDCPPTPDPLAGRAAPTVGACTFTNTVVSSGNVFLNPGTYCGGLTIQNNAIVNMNPGTYIIKDGPFKVQHTATLTGKNVSIFTTGLLGLINFRDDATINLSGAETGPMAGLLMFDNPSATGLRVHNISASHAQTLTGTIYLPKAVLLVDPNANVGEKSAYTAIVVNRMAVENGPNLVLNSDYSATAVPVPDGIRSTTSVVLSN